MIQKWLTPIVAAAALGAAGYSAYETHALRAGLDDAHTKIATLNKQVATLVKRSTPGVYPADAP